MSKSNHPIEQKELMAYLDGELATNRAVAAAAHLEHCAECQEMAADIRKMSQEVMKWEVVPADTSQISADIAAALEKRGKKPSKVTGRRAWGMLFPWKRLAWAGGAMGWVLVAGIFYLQNQPTMQWMDSRNSAQYKVRSVESSDKYLPFSRPDFYNGNGAAGKPPRIGNGDTTSVDRGLDNVRHVNAPPPPLPAGGPSNARPATAPIVTAQLIPDDEADSSERTVPSVPMIAKVAALTLTTKNFDNARASLEEILKRHNGYMGELKVSAPADSGRALTATLRIPAAQLDSALTELKKLGRVEDESQGGEEVTQQYVDLEARLANGKHTEQRLTEILRQRTGKLQDVLKVELEIDRVRGEIEQMQAEKKELSKRVAFATLSTMVKEEYFAKLQGAPASTGSRFRNAAVDGYNTVVEGLISVGLFLLSAGPSLLLWAAILFFPARWAWKKFRAARKRENLEEKI